MESITLDQLNKNPKNPRQISKHDFDSLKQSIKKFGDLSGIVFNTRTQQLVGGHQRLEAFKAIEGDKKVVITNRYEAPNAHGTVAVGYVEYHGEMFSYREVDWDKDFEAAANIAANRIQGEFDKDLLAELTHELSQLENGDELLGLTGQTEKEIKKLLESVGAVEPEQPQDQGDEPEQPQDQGDEPEQPDKLEFSLTRDQRLIIERTIEQVKGTENLQAIEHASLNGAALFVICQEYLQNHPQTETPTSQNNNTLDEIPQEPANAPVAAQEQIN